MSKDEIRRHEGIWHVCYATYGPDGRHRPVVRLTVSGWDNTLRVRQRLLAGVRGRCAWVMSRQVPAA